jgi:hypothetical protein
MRATAVLTLIAAMMFLQSPGESARPIGSGLNDLVLSSSLGYDRSPCYLEWWQFGSDWKLQDYRCLKQTNETWTGIAAGDWDSDGYPELMTPVDNNRGYSHIRVYNIDRYGTFRNPEVNEVAPVEAWRHYTGATFCDFDRDGDNDILALCTDRDGKRGLTRFECGADGKIISEHLLISFDETACGLATDTRDSRNTIFIAFPGRRNKGGKIVEYELTGNKPQVVRKISLPAKYGQLGGVAFKQSGKSRVLVFCTHDWDSENETDAADKSSTQANTTFILPVADAGSIVSSLYMLELGGKKSTVPILIDTMRGRRWTGVSFVNNLSRKPSNQPQQFTGGKGILHIRGLFDKYYGIPAFAESRAMQYTQWPIKCDNQSWSFVHSANWQEIGKYDCVVISNTPLWALGESGVDAVRGYVKSGGRLIFINGPNSGKPGGYAGSGLEDILPVHFKGHGISSHSLKGFIFKKPLQTPRLTGESLWFVNGARLSSGSQKLISLGEDIICARRMVGKGSIIYFGGMPFGEYRPELMSVWQSLK